MKATIILCALASTLVASSCRPTVDAVPDNGRVVVAPKGTSESEKPWNNITKAEGDARLGPLSGMRR